MMEHRERWIITLATLLLPVVYVLSQAPALWLVYGTAPPPPPPPPPGVWWCSMSLDERVFSAAHSWECVYLPVDWLVDETPLGPMLMGWSKLWGVDDIARTRSMLRFFERHYR